MLSKCKKVYHFDQRRPTEPLLLTAFLIRNATTEQTRNMRIMRGQSPRLILTEIQHPCLRRSQAMQQAALERHFLTHQLMMRFPIVLAVSLEILKPYQLSHSICCRYRFFLGCSSSYYNTEAPCEINSFRDLILPTYLRGDDLSSGFSKTKKKDFEIIQCR